ncbi:MAG: PKD domain-containing protein, partial [Bacteroidota bacterium]
NFLFSFLIYKAMFRFFKSFVFPVILTSLLFSCEDEEDLGPPPTVSFTPSAKVAEIGELLTFTNESTAANGSLVYTWDFGDGDQSTNATPQHFYSDTGSYTITLTATTELGATDVFEDNITVGRRYLTSLELLNWSDSSFTVIDDSIVFIPWDEDNSAPDIAWVVFGPGGQEIDTRDNPAQNVTQAPFIVDIQGDFLLSNDFYTVAVGDVDEVADSVDWMVIRQGAQSIVPLDPSLTFHLDPDQDPFETPEYIQGKNPITGEGSILIGNDPNQFDLAIGFMNFEIR